MSEPISNMEYSLDVSKTLSASDESRSIQPTDALSLDQLKDTSTPASRNNDDIDFFKKPPDQTEDISPTTIMKWRALRTSLRADPHDPEGWKRLIELAKNSGITHDLQETYDALLDVYPNTVCYLHLSLV